MIPKISVIVAVYNAEKYLHRSVDSLLAQTFRDFEILLVDDGSLDNSKQICDEYAVLDSRIRVFHKKKWWCKFYSSIWKGTGPRRLHNTCRPR